MMDVNRTAWDVFTRSIDKAEIEKERMRAGDLDAERFGSREHHEAMWLHEVARVESSRGVCCRLRMFRIGLQIGSVVVADWRDGAVCATTDPDLFFPDIRDPARLAKRICDSCPVKQECLEYAIEAGEEYGVWGGTTELERRHLMSIPRRNTGGKPQIDRVKFWQLNDAGLTALEIAEQLGCHADSVSRMRQERRP